MPEDDGPPLEAGTRLVLVRHAESLSNALGVIGGHEACTGLSELGLQQAEVLAARLRRTGELSGVAAVYASLMLRASQTAGILLPALGDVPLTQTCDVCEQHPGEADGMTWVDYERQFGRYSPRREPNRPLSPGGETWADFLDRVETALVAIARRHGGELVVVVTHGGLIAASLIAFFALPHMGADASLLASNSSLTEWCHTGRRWRLVHYNDTAHLGAAGLPRGGAGPTSG